VIPERSMTPMPPMGNTPVLLGRCLAAYGPHDSVAAAPIRKPTKVNLNATPRSGKSFLSGIDMHDKPKSDGRIQGYEKEPCRPRSCAVPWHAVSYRLLLPISSTCSAFLNLTKLNSLKKPLRPSRPYPPLEKSAMKPTVVINAGPPRPPTSISIGWK
jgi:hypothetical protein